MGNRTPVQSPGDSFVGAGDPCVVGQRPIETSAATPPMRSPPLPVRNKSALEMMKNAEKCLHNQSTTSSASDMAQPQAPFSAHPIRSSALDLYSRRNLIDTMLDALNMDRLSASAECDLAAAVSACPEQELSALLPAVAAVLPRLPCNMAQRVITALQQRIWDSVAVGQAACMFKCTVLGYDESLAEIKKTRDESAPEIKAPKQDSTPKSKEMEPASMLHKPVATGLATQHDSTALSDSAKPGTKSVKASQSETARFRVSSSSLRSRDPSPAPPATRVKKNFVNVTPPQDIEFSSRGVTLASSPRSPIVSLPLLDTTTPKMHAATTTAPSSAHSSRLNRVSYGVETGRHDGWNIVRDLHVPPHATLWLSNLRRKIITGEIDNTTMVSPPGPVCHPWTHERAARIALPMPPNTRRSGGRVRVWQSWTTQRLSAQTMPIAPRQRGGRLFRIVSLLEAHAHSALEKILLKATRSAKPLPDAAPELETDLHTLLALCRQVRRFQQGRSLDLGPSTPTGHRRSRQGHMLRTWFSKSKVSTGTQNDFLAALQYALRASKASEGARHSLVVLVSRRRRRLCVRRHIAVVPIAAAANAVWKRNRIDYHGVHISASVARVESNCDDIGWTEAFPGSFGLENGQGARAAAGAWRRHEADTFIASSVGAAALILALRLRCGDLGEDCGDLHRSNETKLSGMRMKKDGGVVITGITAWLNEQPRIEMRLPPAITRILGGHWSTFARLVSRALRALRSDAVFCRLAVCVVTSACLCIEGFESKSQQQADVATTTVATAATAPGSEVAVQSHTTPSQHQPRARIVLRHVVSPPPTSTSALTPPVSPPPTSFASSSGTDDSSSSCGSQLYDEKTSSVNILHVSKRRVIKRLLGSYLGKDIPIKDVSDKVVCLLSKMATAPPPPPFQSIMDCICSRVEQQSTVMTDEKNKKKAAAATRPLANFRFSLGTCTSAPIVETLYALPAAKVTRELPLLATFITMWKPETQLEIKKALEARMETSPAIQQALHCFVLSRGSDSQLGTVRVGTQYRSTTSENGPPLSPRAGSDNSDKDMAKSGAPNAVSPRSPDSGVIRSSARRLSSPARSRRRRRGSSPFWSSQRRSLFTGSTISLKDFGIPPVDAYPDSGAIPSLVSALRGRKRGWNTSFWSFTASGRESEGHTRPDATPQGVGGAKRSSISSSATLLEWSVEEMKRQLEVKYSQGKFTAQSTSSESKERDDASNGHKKPIPTRTKRSPRRATRPPRVVGHRWLSGLASAAAKKPGFTMGANPSSELVFHPIFPDFKVATVAVRHVFKSKLKPALVTAGGYYLPGADFDAKRDLSFIYKTGDDLRLDWAVLACFRYFNRVWARHRSAHDNCGLEFNGIPIHAFAYTVVPTQWKQGVIEYVDGATPLVDVDKMMSQFKPDALNRLVASAVGSYIAAFVLGIRDRHHDNILINAAGTLFHVDFGFIFGEKPTFDTSRFAITKRLYLAFGLYWTQFINLCVQAYLSLVEEHQSITSFVCKAFRGLRDPITIASHMRATLMLDLPRDAACAKLRTLMEKAPTSYGTRLKNFMHQLAVSTQ